MLVVFLECLKIPARNKPLIITSSLDFVAKTLDCIINGQGVLDDVLITNNSLGILLFSEKGISLFEFTQYFFP